MLSDALRTVALAAAAVTAEHYLDSMAHDGSLEPFTDFEGAGVDDDAHIDEIDTAAQTFLGRALTREERVELWPAYAASVHAKTSAPRNYAEQLRPPPVVCPLDHALDLDATGQCRGCVDHQRHPLQPSAEVRADLEALSAPCMVPPAPPLLDRVVLALLTRYPGVEVKPVVLGPEHGRGMWLVTVYVERDGARGWRRCVDGSGITYELAVKDLATMTGVR